MRWKVLPSRKAPSLLEKTKISMAAKLLNQIANKIFCVFFFSIWKSNCFWKKIGLGLVYEEIENCNRGFLERISPRFLFFKRKLYANNTHLHDSLVKPKKYHVVLKMYNIHVVLIDEASQSFGYKWIKTNAVFASFYLLETSQIFWRKKLYVSLLLMANSHCVSVYVYYVHLCQ